MHNAKKILACAMAVLLCAGVVGCGNSSSSSSSHVDQIQVTLPENVDPNDESTLTVSDIPEGEPTELDWLSYWDINPEEGNPEKRAELQLFEQKGGSIKWSRVRSDAKYEKLASRLMSNDPPDMWWYEQAMDFPVNCLQNMFQPVDDIVDFNTPLWSDVKDKAEEYTIAGSHFVAPIKFNFQGILTYDKDRIEELGVDDPYEMYLNDEWDWNALEDICRAWVDTSTDDEPRIGLNGWFHTFIFASTGETVVMRDDATGKYINNIDSPNLERAANWLYNMSKDGLIDNKWIQGAQNAFNEGYLFYSMGPWASIDSHTPKDGTNWANVPIPRDPNSDKLYAKLDTVAYMWIKGSAKSGAMKTWLECAKIVATDPAYMEQDKQKFFVNNPNWTDEMYELAYNPMANEKITVISDPGYGISTLLSDQDSATNDSKEAVIQLVYSSVSKTDESGAQLTWAVVRDMYNNTINSELAAFNDKLANYSLGGAYTPEEDTTASE